MLFIIYYLLSGALCGILPAADFHGNCLVVKISKLFEVVAQNLNL